MNALKLLITLLAIGAVSGCAAKQKILGEPWEPPEQITPVYEPPTSGAIYQANADTRLFEDLKAGRVGDILTVRLIENTSASNASSTQTAKSTEATLGNPTVFGQVLTKQGQPLFQGSLDGESSFDGSGSTSQSNSLAGDITVTIVQRLPNGNLRIRGEKWMNLNQGREFIRVAGIIRAADINTDNTIASTRIADAQISYSSRGVMAAANRMGPIARFFNSILHPY
ncbi:MAG: flagellar basal body L-ring protein FlgH [Pseudomonadota bacterium]